MYPSISGSPISVDNSWYIVVPNTAKTEPIYDSMSLIEGMERLPFQLHIWFMGRDGAQNLRVVTMDRPVTKDRQFAEQSKNIYLFCDLVES